MDAKKTYLEIAGQYLNETSIQRLENILNTSNSLNSKDLTIIRKKVLDNYLKFLQISKRDQSNVSVFFWTNGELVTSESLNNGATIDMVFETDRVTILSDRIEEFFNCNDRDMEIASATLNEVLSRSRSLLALKNKMV